MTERTKDFHKFARDARILGQIPAARREVVSSFPPIVCRRVVGPAVLGQDLFDDAGLEEIR